MRVLFVEKQSDYELLVREAGMQRLTTNMLGLPGGTSEHDFETLALNQACRLPRRLLNNPFLGGIGTLTSESQDQSDGS